MKCEVSGKACDENCPTQYEAGNMGEIIENLEAISEILEQQSCDLDGAREDFIHDVYNTLDFLPTNNEANRIIDSFDRVTSELKQQPYDDAVSRQAVLDQAVDYGSNTYLIPVNSVKTLPSVTPQPKIGRWIMPQQDDGMSDPIYYQVRCSKCNFDLDPQTWNQELHQYNADKYCPNCGARMVNE